MAFVDVAIAVGAAVGLEGGAAILGGGAIIGAGTGAAYSAITGDGNILNSALTGGLIGGAGAYGLGAMGAGSAATQAAMAGPFWGGAAMTPAQLAAANTNTPAMLAAANASADPIAGLNAANMWTGEGAALANTPAGGAMGSTLGSAGSGLTTGQILGYGLAGSAALSLLGNMNTPKLSSQPQGQNPAYIRPYTYAANPTNNYPTSNNGLGSSAERTYFNPTMTAQPIYKAAQGGLTPNVDFMGSGAYPMSQQQNPTYAVPTQMPTSAKQVMASYEPDTNPLTGQAIAMAEGGAVDINNINPQIWNQVDTLVSRVANAQPTPAPEVTMANNPAVRAYNDAIMAKAAQTYAAPQGGLPQVSQAQAQPQALAPQGYQAPQAPANFDSGLLSQWQAANPQSRAYNSLTQTYGAGIPNQAQYDAFKAQKDQEAADAQNAFSFRPFSFGSGDGGGGAGGGLPRDFAYAGGGHLGGYSDGGRMLKGPGDGMSDNIPASIGGKQPARLADGEFVVPADVVSHLGNGSTDAGAKRLYSMMDNVRKARTGSKKQGKQIKAEKYLPT